MSRYLTELVTRRCGIDLLAANVFPNAKEVTESFGAYSAARRYLKREFPLNDTNVTCVCVGDGSRPRTALTFALRSRWNCISVDPNMKVFNLRVFNRRAVDRLVCHRSRIEDMYIMARRVVVVAVHSHARLPESIAAVRADQIAVIAMPCCVPLELDAPPDIEYQDPNIMSKMNTIKIWRNAWRPQH